MPAKKRNGNGNSSGIGSMSAKQLKRKKPINTDAMVDIKPLTKNQERFFEAYEKGKNIFAYGAAGTGKTFVALYLALRDVLDQITPYEKVYVVRSLVSTREIGFLPGDHEDKSFLYQIPYKNMVSICSRCLLIRTLRCFMVHSKLKRQLGSGLPHSFVELQWTIVLY